MTAFDPAAYIAACEAAGARLLLLIHEDGSSAVSTAYREKMDYEKMPAGGLTSDQLEAVCEELWRQGKATYSGPAPRRRA